MASTPTQVSKTIASTNDATEWVELQPGDSARISIASGITGTVNVQSSFDGSNVEGAIAAEGGVTNFSAGAQLQYASNVREFIRVIGTTVSSGTASAKIRRN